MAKPICTEKSPSDRTPLRSRKSVVLVIGKVPNPLTNHVKLLIDEGLARLIASKIARDHIER
jgi:hypothetical protein